MGERGKKYANGILPEADETLKCTFKSSLLRIEKRFLVSSAVRVPAIYIEALNKYTTFMCICSHLVVVSAAHFHSEGSCSFGEESFASSFRWLQLPKPEPAN